MLESFLFGSHVEEDEKVVLIVHKHWLQGVKELAFPVISFLFAAFVLLQDIKGFALYVVGAWFVFSAFWLVRNFFDYYMDAWIVTDHGVIDLAWHGWFHRQSTRILYSDIEGVSYEIQGFLATVFRYGVLTVEKISTGGSVSLSHVPQPKRIEGQILRHMEAYLHKKNLKNAKHVEELLSKFVAQKIQEKKFDTSEDASDD